MSVHSFSTGIKSCTISTRAVTSCSTRRSLIFRWPTCCTIQALAPIKAPATCHANAIMCVCVCMLHNVQFKHWPPSRPPQHATQMRLNVCMYVCIYIYIYIHTHILLQFEHHRRLYAHTCTHSHTYFRTFCYNLNITPLKANIYTHTHTNIYIHTY